MNIIRKAYRFFFIRHKAVSTVLFLLLLFGYWFCLPSPLFDDPTCTIIEDREGRLLGARIAHDGQWRFPPTDSVPEKFAKAIVTFEDKRFFSHPGFDPLAFGRAIRQNLQARTVVSGGSTLTMQTIRLSRKGKSRTIWQKLVELVLATRLELQCSKHQILAHYASHAPFGGNVVGLDAAAWRYFGKKPEALSWSESAMLAVLPNAPSLIHPGRNRELLFAKRNRLLQKLFWENTFDSLTYELAVQEPLPDQPHPLPRHAPHLLERVHKEQVIGGKKQHTSFRTTIDYELQAQANQIAKRRGKILRHNGIHNLAILVLDVKTGATLAYVGNAPEAGGLHGEAVDIITSARSTGSILKPFLYAEMLQDGSLLPSQLVSDVPIYLSGYRPQNYLDTYDGAVPADRALSRSLNVPFIKLLQQYGTERFHFDLKKLGLTTITRSPGNYGLTLILGGAEAKLWDLTGTYASMARRLGNFYPRNGLYSPMDFRSPEYLFSEEKIKGEKWVKADANLSADAIYLTFKAMLSVERPDTEGNWEQFSSSRKVAWKTGTSIGFRDAWAIGVTPEYAVGVWVGNADGEGRPGLVGVHAAAPILFEVFDKLPQTSWFEPPYDVMKQVEICAVSGYLPKMICPKDTIWGPAKAMDAGACPYHQTVHLDKTQSWQVGTSCYPKAEMQTVPWFLLPPDEAYYFRSKHPEYQELPPFLPACGHTDDFSKNRMALIYPKVLSAIKIPKELDGSFGKVVFQASHSSPNLKIYWHIDQTFIGTTETFHSMELHPSPGEHWLTLVDENGGRLVKKFIVEE